MVSTHPDVTLQKISPTMYYTWGYNSDNNLSLLKKKHSKNVANTSACNIPKLMKIF